MNSVLSNPNKLAHKKSITEPARITDQLRRTTLKKDGDKLHKKNNEKERILFCGSKSLGLKFLEKLLEATSSNLVLVCHPDDSADSRSVRDKFTHLCQDKVVNLKHISSEQELQSVISKYKPDIAIVCGWYKVISAETLSSIPLGFIGIHNSLLPKYRGGAPLVWALINGEREIGSTMFKLAAGVDNGEILKQVSVQRSDFEPVGSVLERLEQKVLEDFPATFIKYIANPWPLRAQIGLPSQFPNRKPSDGLVDFTLSAPEVCNFINAQSEPYPGAFTVRDERIIKLHNARLDDRQKSSSSAPTHTKLGFIAPTLEFLCGDGRVIQVDEWTLR